MEAVEVAASARRRKICPVDETAKIIGCAEGTVKKHLQKIYRKWHVSNRVAAVLCFKA